MPPAMPCVPEMAGGETVGIKGQIPLLLAYAGKPGIMSLRFPYTTPTLAG